MKLNNPWLIMFSLLFLGIILNAAGCQSSANEVFSVTPPSHSVVLLSHPKGGMFSALDNVLLLAKNYDHRKISGFKIDFAATGPYYDASYGPNWWQYYFKPLQKGEVDLTSHATNTPSLYYSIKNTPYIEEQFSPQEANSIIKKYFHLHPHIQEKVDKYLATFFQDNFIIGVHYRGTDKASESPRVSYETMQAIINKLAATLQKGKDYRIFVATDENNFIHFMKMNFPNQVIYLEDSIRSVNGNPIHLDSANPPYKIGEDAILDCLILSKTNFLIRTSSNLSRWSTYFNPDLPVIELNQRYGK